MKLVYDDQLNADLARILKEGEKFITIISPYIKLSQRIKDYLKQTAKNNPLIKLVVIFGKNEGAPDKSLKKFDLDFFIDEFNDVSIYYKDRLHAKCYINEKMGMVTSMNLYDYSLEHNLELGVCFENSGLFDDLIKQTGKALDYLNNSKTTSIEGQVYNYIEHVKASSICYYEKKAIIKETNFGLTTKYSHSEVSINNLDKFFKKYVDSKVSIVNEIEEKLEEKFNVIVKAPLKKTSVKKAPVKKPVKEKILTKETSTKPEKSIKKNTKT